MRAILQDHARHWTDGDDLPCHCPYADTRLLRTSSSRTHRSSYAQSVVINKVTGAFIKDLKTLEFNHRPRGAFGIGISMKVEGRPQPIRHYSEMELEEEVVCDCCTMRYTVFGTFAFCPDCGKHNSLQILEKNLVLAQKQIDLAATVEGELAAQLVADALRMACQRLMDSGVRHAEFMRASNKFFQGRSGFISEPRRCAKKCAVPFRH